MVTDAEVVYEGTSIFLFNVAPGGETNQKGKRTSKGVKGYLTPGQPPTQCLNSLTAAIIIQDDTGTMHDIMQTLSPQEQVQLANNPNPNPNLVEYITLATLD